MVTELEHVDDVKAAINSIHGDPSIYKDADDTMVPVARLACNIKRFYKACENKGMSQEAANAKFSMLLEVAVAEIEESEV